MKMRLITFAMTLMIALAAIAPIASAGGWRP